MAAVELRDGGHRARDGARVSRAARGDIVDRWIFAGNRPLVREVRIGSEILVQDGRHRDRETITARYRDAIPKLLAG